MATGTGIQQNGGIETSRATPDVNLSTGAAEAFNGLANAGRAIEEAVQPLINDYVAQKGAKEGAAVAAGTQPYKAHLAIGEAGRARAAALETAYTAGVRNDVDARLAAARREAAYDPDAYEKKAKEIVSGFIQGAPPRFAVDVEAYANSRKASYLQVVANEREQRDQQEVALSIGARETSLVERATDLVSQVGGENTPEFLDTEAEYRQLLVAKAANPAIAFTPEQATLAMDKFHDGLQGAVLSRDTVAAYAANGRGLPGRAAALRDLSSEFEHGEGAFSAVAPERRQRLFNDAKKQLDTVYAGDREMQRAEDEAERDRKAAARERRGELMLGVVTGATGVKEILADQALDDGDKAVLLNAAKAAARSAAAEGRAAAAAERAGRALVYADLRDQAEAGILDPADVAAHVTAGLLGQGQARTLATKNDKTLKPVIDDVLAPYKDVASRPGMSMRATKAQLSKAEDEAANWARMNPNAPLDERLKVGDLMAKKYFGGNPGGTQKTVTDDKRDRVSRLQQLEAKRKAGQITQTDYTSQRAALLKN